MSSHAILLLFMSREDIDKQKPGLDCTLRGAGGVSGGVKKDLSGSSSSVANTHTHAFTHKYTHTHRSFCGNWEVRSFEKPCKHLYQNCLVGKLTLVALQNIPGWVNSFSQLQFFPIILLWKQRRRKKGMSLYWESTMRPEISMCTKKGSPTLLPWERPLNADWM